MVKTITDIKKTVRDLTSRPGVYRMLDAKGAVLYVGKAANLRKRVASYFGRQQDSPKTRALVAQICGIEVTVTRTEGEALLLESNLIKEYRPRYNVFFRDDKSYPYLYLAADEAFPRLSFYRGACRGKGRYFGPFPSAGAARRTLNLTQKLFRIRQCDNTFFRNRARPCLQYQIQRCTAPCVGLIGEDEYASDVELAALFLEGRNEEVIEALTGPMQEAAAALEFERAARYRDRIASLRQVQEQQHITLPKGDCDVVGIAQAEERTCVQVFCVRGGRNLGNRAYFPRHEGGAAPEEIMEAFLTQYYLAGRGREQIPKEILLSHCVADPDLFQAVLSDQRGSGVVLRHRHRGNRARWVRMAGDNAEVALRQQLHGRERIRHRLDALQSALGLAEGIEHIECFDVSHTRGEATVGACVVFDADGPVTGEYRRYNIREVAPGDDYGALRQVVERRYGRVRREEGRLPDLILIDGGKGQVNGAVAVLRELQMDHVPLVGVAKGRTRKPGMESLILSDGGSVLRLPPTSPALHLIQEVRDEAHRFAITGHRRRRTRQRTTSRLEDIAGVGNKRRQQLLRHFGGLQGVERAGIEELAKVPGINKNLAQRIYDALHDRP